MIEVPMLRMITFQGPLWNDQLHARFGGWVLNFLTLKLLGFNEVALFLPTVVISASFPVLAYLLLVGGGYGPLPAALAASHAPSRPFDLLLGARPPSELTLAR